MADSYGYLDAIAPGQAVAVRLGGAPVIVERARLGLHLRLARQESRVEERLQAGDAAGAAAALRAYLEMAGVDGGAATGPEMIVAYRRLCAANRLQIALPFMRDEGPPAGPPLPYDYPGRGQAWWVHKLASRYGWPRDHILGLWPEEAACYLQEILVAEFDEADEQRALSELAYAYDEGSRTATFRPVPRPAWMVGDRLKRGRVPRRILPSGNVVDLSGYGVAKREIVH